MTQRAALAIERDRLGELVEELRREHETGVEHPHGYGLLLALAGGLDEDPVSFARELPTDGTRIPSIGIASIMAIEHQHRELAEVLVSELDAMPDVVLATGLGTLLLGFVPHLRGALRLVLDDVDGAIHDLERGLTPAEPTGGELWLGHTRVDLALALQRRGLARDRERVDHLVALVRSSPAMEASSRLRRRFDRLC